jgi:hypothetical protein
MRVLVACEFSGIVRDAFAARGHDAWSCDLLASERPGNHIQGDLLEVINDGWDLLIAHPPCTYLTVSGNAWFNVERYGQKAIDRIFLRHEALGFVLRIYYSGVERIAIENPIGYLSSAFRDPDQVIQPYYFGDPERKATCLWLRNLRPLEYRLNNDLFGAATAVEPNIVTRVSKRTGRTFTYSELEYKASMDHENRAHLRSKTFPGIARAMAEQWG